MYKCFFSNSRNSKIFFKILIILSSVSYLGIIYVLYIELLGTHTKKDFIQAGINWNVTITFVRCVCNNFNF